MEEGKVPDSSGRLDTRVNLRMGKRTLEAYRAIAERLEVPAADLFRYVLDMHVLALESLNEFFEEEDEKDKGTKPGPGLVGFEEVLAIIEQDIHRDRTAVLNTKSDSTRS